MALKMLGITWVRWDMSWNAIQSNSATTYNWDGPDRIVETALKYGIKSLAIITYTPFWARSDTCPGSDKCAPKDPTQFADFAAQVVARYKDKGSHYWEIWNEPNTAGFWAVTADCDAYTTLLKAAYPAIKSVDPNAIVITGGLAPAATDGVNMNPRDFLSCIYKDGGKDYFDAVGHHPYTYPQFPSSIGETAWAQMALTNPSLRSIMTANGDDAKKIWLTEFGAPTNGPDSWWYVSETKQSDMMTDAFKLYKGYDWVGPIFLYSLKDSGTSPSTNENFFGLMRFDGGFKPAYDTLKSIISSGI